MTLPMALHLEAVEPLPEHIARYFAICEEKLGLVPNVLRCYTHAPAKFDAFTALYNELMLADSGLTKYEREMIAVVVSAENHCVYCVVAHGAALRQLSDDRVVAETIAVNYRHAGLSPRHQAICDFAVKLTNRSAEISEHDRQTLRDVGLHDADIFDVASVAAFFNMTNRVASAVAMEPNSEYHVQARAQL
jgi:uncharacterized peroxidase-related enzyme